MTHNENDNTIVMIMFNLVVHLLGIIMLRVSFCRDIWDCNILAYYLDN